MALAVPLAIPLAAPLAAPLEMPGAISRATPPAPAPARARAPGTKAPAARLKYPKAATAAECHTLEQLPNVGPAFAGDLRRLGIERPEQLAGHDPLSLYQALCKQTGTRQDPCVLDTFIAITDFMAGAPPAPWWHYTPQRKRAYGPVV